MRKEIIPLTSLRGIAAMAVIAMHFSATMQINATGNFPSLAPSGQLAVDVFFVLSGFIMAYTYLPLFEAESSLAAYCIFLVKRAARILPLNIAITVLLVAAVLLSGPVLSKSLFPHVVLNNWPVDLAANAMMLPGLGIGTSINWPAWSISVEFAAYLMFPLFLVCIFHPRPIVSAATSIAACMLLIAVCLTDGHLAPDGIHNHPWPWRDLGRCISEFVLGLGVYRIYRSGRLADLFEKDATILGISIAILLLVVCRSPNLFVLPFFPPLILALSLNKGWVARLMSMRFLHFLGVISFSLYLVHDNFRGVAVYVIRSLHPALLSPAQAMILAAASTFLMIFPAWLSYSLIEKPGRELFRSGLRRRPMPSLSS
ncbi:MAG TPA: acyltransferase [Rhizomicrobium sp.]|nr:acyltransferase [Rhizomicrobium sp.]